MNIVLENIFLQRILEGEISESVFGRVFDNIKVVKRYANGVKPSLFVDQIDYLMLFPFFKVHLVTVILIGNRRWLKYQGEGLDFL